MTLVTLFKQIAPSYDSANILTHFEKKFAKIEKSQREVLIAECIKFLFLRSLHGKGFIPLKGDVDDIWHEFILQTQEYETFCLALPAQKFIHHNSVHLEEFSEGKDKKEVVKNLLEWIPNYRQHFGDFTEAAAENWMIVGFLQSKLKLTLAQINQL